MIVNPSPLDPHCKVKSEHDATASQYRWETTAGVFHLAVTELSENLILLVWLAGRTGLPDEIPNAGPAMIFDLAGKCEVPYDAGYVETRMGIGAPYAVAICQFMRFLFPDFQFRA